MPQIIIGPPLDDPDDGDGGFEVDQQSMSHLVPNVPETHQLAEGYDVRPAAPNRQIDVGEELALPEAPPPKKMVRDSIEHVTHAQNALAKKRMETKLKKTEALANKNETALRLVCESVPMVAKLCGAPRSAMVGRKKNLSHQTSSCFRQPCVLAPIAQAAQQAFLTNVCYVRV